MTAAEFLTSLTGTTARRQPAPLTKRRVVRTLQSPIRLPARRLGDFEVKHETLKPHVPISVISMRQALLTGRPPCNVTVNAPLRVHTLAQVREGGDSVWMSDTPAELFEMQEFARGARGHVLVGGLGLGIVASLLAEQKAVERVTVVEIEPAVIDLVEPHLKPRVREKVTVVLDDLFRFLKTATAWPWDLAVLDTWRGTGEAEWVETVAPLRRIIRNRFGAQKVRCWAEDVMLGQMRSALVNHVGDHPEKVWGDGHKAFHRALSMERPTALFYTEPSPSTPEVAMLRLHRNHADQCLKVAASAFLRGVGSKEWERRFGKFWPRQEGQ